MHIITFAKIPLGPAGITSTKSDKQIKAVISRQMLRRKTSKRLIYE